MTHSKTIELNIPASAEEREQQRITGGWDKWYTSLPDDLKRKLSIYDFKRLGDCFRRAFDIPDSRQPMTHDEEKVALANQTHRLVPELLPCPFCQGQAQFGSVPITHAAHHTEGGAYIECTECQASTALVFPMKSDAKPELSERWNRRAAPQPQDSGEEYQEWQHGCDAIQNMVTLWIARCPMCGKPRPALAARSQP
jgi:hypothetical protein